MCSNLLLLLYLHLQFYNLKCQIKMHIPDYLSDHDLIDCWDCFSRFPRDQCLFSCTEGANRVRLSKLAIHFLRHMFKTKQFPDLIWSYWSFFFLDSCEQETRLHAAEDLLVELVHCCVLHWWCCHEASETLVKMSIKFYLNVWFGMLFLISKSVQPKHSSTAFAYCP